MTKTLKNIQQLEDRTAQSRCDEGFLQVRRVLLQNHYEDGTRSRPYACDIVERKFVDAVAVIVYAKKAGRVLAGLREGMRPPLFFRYRRDIPIEDRQDYRHFVEVVAGAIESDDHGWDGLKRRAAMELKEEAGIEADPSDVEILGGGLFSSPGTTDEKVYFAAVEVDDPERRGTPAGDGSPMEEVSHIIFLPLEEALEKSMSGAYEDGKTEVALWRLAHRLGLIQLKA
jgi:ADP-ribose pyrophosphatase